MTGLTQAEAAQRAGLLLVDSYQVFLDLTGDGESVRSRTEIRFSCREPGAASFADLDAIAVHEVTLNGVPVDPGLIDRGRLPLHDLGASNSLTVDATMALAGTGSGLTRYTDPADGAQYILANCFPTAAPRVFCCFDQPDLRAAITLIVTLPAGWTCVANGEVLHQPDDGAAGVWRFSTVGAMKPYEFTFCCGSFVSVPDAAAAPAAAAAAAPAGGGGAGDRAGDGAGDGSRRLDVHCRASLAGSPGLARIGAIVRAALDYYEDYLGVPRPYDKLDIVFAPELGPLAMQLPAVMYVSETLLQRAADPEDEHVAVVLAHEAAHLWFGCLVEGSWWDDLWLAEALASYLSYGAAAAVLGRPDAWADFGMTGEASAYQADSLPGTQPVSSPVDSAANALTRPAAITYSKGTAVLRQLATVIGEEAMRAGLHDYLSRYGWATTSLSYLIECWSRACGRDLTDWADQWLLQAGVNALRPQITVGPDGVITSLAVVQDAPATAAPGAGAAGPLRAHQLTAGLYELDGPQLKCIRRVPVALAGEWTHVPELTGTRMPAAIILNDADQTFATISFDPASWTSLVACALDVGDPLAESVCWNAAWQLVTAAQLDAEEFAAIVARRMMPDHLAIGLEQLLDRAVTGADFYAPPEQRAAALQNLAGAALSGAECGMPGSRDQRILARGYATCADSSAQLDLLRFWLAGRSLPAGLELDLDLRFAILSGLAARDLLSDTDLAAYAAGDPVGGDSRLATLRARRPTAEAKEEAWAAALAPDQPQRLARAHAEGIWVPGQEKVLEGFRERYFTEALTALAGHDSRTAQRLARALYPAVLADDATIAATVDALARIREDDPVRIVLLEQGALLQRGIAARAR